MSVSSFMFLLYVYLKINYFILDFWKISDENVNQLFKNHMLSLDEEKQEQQFVRVSFF